MFRRISFQLFFVLLAFFGAKALGQGDSAIISSLKHSGAGSSTASGKSTVQKQVKFSPVSVVREFNRKEVPNKVQEAIDVIAEMKEDQSMGVSSTPFSLINKSKKYVFIILSDGEWLKKNKTQLLHKDVAPGEEVTFKLKYKPAQSTLYVWEGNKKDSFSKDNLDELTNGVSSNLKKPISKKRFKVGPTALFKFKPGRDITGDNYGYLRLKWKNGQLLPRKSSDKLLSLSKNIIKRNIRRFDFVRGIFSNKKKSSHSGKNQTEGQDTYVDDPVLNNLRDMGL